MRIRLGSAIAAALVGLLTGVVVPAPAAATVPEVDHVVLVSVDGLNPEAIRRLGRAGAPTFHRLMDQGAFTLNARTVHESTQTLPNHTSMVTGRPVTATGGHRVTFNEDNGSTVHARAGSYVAGIFDVVHDNGGRTALYSGKDKLDFLDRSWNGTNGAVDRTGVDNGRDKIDVYRRSTPGVLTDALIAALRTAPPALAMIHYRGPDGVGHAQGYMSQAYLTGEQHRPHDRPGAGHDRRQPIAGRVDGRRPDERPRRARHVARERRPGRQLHDPLLRVGSGRGRRHRPLRTQPRPGCTRDLAADVLRRSAADPQCRGRQPGR